MARKFVDSQRPGLKGDIEDDFDLTQVLGPAKELTNSLGMKLFLIQPGESMGTEVENSRTRGRIIGGRTAASDTDHQAVLLGAYEVNQEQWTRVMQTAPWAGKPACKAAEIFRRRLFPGKTRWRSVIA